jgi:hypothetical protein
MKYRFEYHLPIIYNEFCSFILYLVFNDYFVLKTILQQ